MKMVKKILLGLAATAAVLSMAGCKMTDDEEKAMGGTADKPTVEYENKNAENYRCYRSTSFSHAGAIVKVIFENPDTSGKSKMGVIFDLHKNDKDKNAVDFYIIGLSAQSGSDVSNFYVSKFENVTDMQAENFGTELAENPADETELIELASSHRITKLPSKAEDGTLSYYVYYKALKEGSYEYAVLDMTDATAKTLKAKNLSISSMPEGVTVLKSGTIKNAFTAVTDDSKLPQNKIGCYAMIPSSTKLKGHWDFFDTYLEAEEIEE